MPLKLTSVLIQVNKPISHAVFPESGIVSTIADTAEGRIEIGLIGREGFVGSSVILSANQVPHTSLIQGTGEGLRISTDDLREVIKERPSIFKPLGLFTQSLIVQVAQTAYANAPSTLETRLAPLGPDDPRSL